MSYNQIAGQKIGRVEALSDGVFSIAMTLLVFDLKLPVGAVIESEAALWEALVEMSPKFLTFLLSFLTLGIIWTGQTTQFHYVKRYDRTLTWYSLFFLMTVSLLPFSTSVLSAHIENKVSIGVYWLNLFAMGGILFLHWDYAYRNDYLDFAEKDAAFVNNAIRKRIIFAQRLYLVGVSLCFINPYISIAFIIGLQLYVIFQSKSKF